MTGRLAGVACLALAAAACGHAIFVPPSGPGTSVTDPAPAWTSATTRCRAAQNYAAALRVSGRVGDQRVWPLSVQTAVTASQSIYMSATVAGRSVFVLAGSARQATLWLRSEKRVVVAPPAEIIDAILGVALPPDRLLAILSGCVTRDLAVKSAVSHGRFMTVDTPDARVFLERDGTNWRTRAGEAEGFVVELRREVSSLPEQIWIRSTPGREPRASIDVSVSDAELNGVIPPAVFTPPAGAADAQPMTIAELRAAGPWKDREPVR